MKDVYGRDGVKINFFKSFWKTKNQGKGYTNSIP